MVKDKRISFKVPDSIRHSEARTLITRLVKHLSEHKKLELSDIPLLHRMATAYDMYLSCVDAIAEHGMTMLNLKGEQVKRPEANLLKESWSQYLELAKEYGLTAKSKGQIKAMNIGDNEKSPLDIYREKREEPRG